MFNGVFILIINFFFNKILIIRLPLWPSIDVNGVAFGAIIN